MDTMTLCSGVLHRLVLTYVSSIYRVKTHRYVGYQLVEKEQWYLKLQGGQRVRLLRPNSI